MKHQTGTTTPTRKAPDQSIRARQHINALVESGTELIDSATARIIAASVHGGHGTALCTFAETGVLDQDAALTELEAVSLPELPQTWREAFTDFVTADRGNSHD